MRRYHLLTLVIFAVLVVEGCSRAGPKRDPVPVGDEKYFLPDDSRELIDKTEPIRDFTYDARKGAGGNLEFQFPDGMFDRNVNIKWEDGVTEEEKKLVTVAKTQYEEKKYQVDRARRETDLKELGKLFLAFCEKTEPAERTFDNLRQYVRRSGNLEMRKMLVDKKIEPALDADLAKPNDIMAYFPSSLREECAFINVKGKVGAFKMPDLERTLKSQRLGAIQKIYKAYVDNNPDERSYKDLKAYLEKNLVAPAYEAHVKKEILLLDPVKPKGKSKAAMPAIACYAKDEGQDRRHLCIYLKGPPGFLDPPLPANYLGK